MTRTGVTRSAVAMTTIREVPGRNGAVRYRFVIDVGTKPNGKRDQRTFTYDGRDDAETKIAQISAARQVWKSHHGAVHLVRDLFQPGICDPNCVFAWATEEDGCTCRCGGEFHGRLSEYETDWDFLHIGPVRAKQQSSRRKPITPQVRERLIELYRKGQVESGYRHRPATFVRERLAEEGVTATMAQINSWIHYLRKRGLME